MTRLSYDIYDYVGKQFNELIVLDYDTDDMFTCMCTCGKQIHVHVSALRDSKIYSCGCKNKTNINKIIDLTNRQFGELKVLEYVGNRYWRCQCSCGKIISTLGKYLTNGTKTSCGCIKGDMDISLGSKIGNWEVIEKRPNYKYLCRCSCGKEQEVLKYRLLDGSSTSCGHLNHNFIDLTNKVFGEWQVVKYNDNGEWLCKCQKGHTKIIKGEYLRHGEATKCHKCKKWFLSLISKNTCIYNRTSQENIKDAIKIELLAYIQESVKSDIEIEHDYEYDGQSNYFDIYIPSKNIAIEICSTQSKDTVIKK